MPTTEKDADRSVNVFKNVLLVLLGFTFIGESYIIYKQHQEKKVLQTDLDTKVANAELSFKAIESNLNDINKREGNIFSALNTNEAKALANVQERITSEIEAINQLMAKNHKLIDDLTASVGEKDERIAKYKKSVAALDKKLKDYRTRTQTLTTQADALRTELEETKKASASIAEALQAKTAELETKSKVIADQTAELDKKDKQIRTAYYTVGTYKELKDKNVLDKEGTFLGLAGAKTLKDDFDHNYFNKIDIYSYTSIPVFSKDAELVTTHDKNSYELVRGPDEEIQYIKITDQDKFWENSKYLVVVADK